MNIHVLLAALVMAQLSTLSAQEAVPLKLTLSAQPLSVTFKNVGTVLLNILRPLDGSESGWVMPYYDLGVADAQGRQAPLGLRCGLTSPYTTRVLVANYLITLKPGEEHEEKLYNNRQIPVAGTYTLQFRYTFGAGVGRSLSVPYPAGLWRGEAVSNTVTARLEPN